MKYLNIILLFAVSVAFISCGKMVTNLTMNEYASELFDLEEKGVITQSKKKDIFLGELFLPFIYSTFRVGGYDHRLLEMFSTWKVFEDSSHVIMCGSVAKEDNDIYVFVWVLKDEGGGRFSTVFLQIGKKIEEGLEYPPFLIPKKY